MGRKLKKESENTTTADDYRMMKRQASLSKQVASELEDILDSKIRKLKKKSENTEMKSDFERLLEANADKMDNIENVNDLSLTDPFEYDNDLNCNSDSS